MSSNFTVCFHKCSLTALCLIEYKLLWINHKKYDNFDFLNNSNTQTFTHDYFEYEQWEADIIVKDRLKANIL
jgi:hypothetical protein